MKSLFLLFCSVFLCGCTSVSSLYNYKIDPTYNRQNETLVIDNLSFNQAVEVYKKTTSSAGFGTTDTKALYILNNPQCQNILYDSSSVNGTKSYFVEDHFSHFLRDKYLRKNGTCNMVIVSNLKFFTCEAENRDITYYVAEYSWVFYNRKQAYKEISSLMVDKTCFNSLYANFEQKATHDEHKIFHYPLTDKDIYESYYPSEK